MNDNEFKDRVKATFDSDVPDVLHQIKASPQFRVPEKPSIWNRLFGQPNKQLLSAVSVFVLALFIVFTARQLNTPVVASTITLDVNPSLVITLDEDDNVISVTAINDDGEEVIERNIRYRGLSIDDFLDIIIDRLERLGYIVTTGSDPNVILIEVDADTITIRDRVEAKFQERLNQKLEEKGVPHWVLNAREININNDHKDALPQNPVQDMVSRAKLTLAYRIIELDDSYELNDLLRASVRQLYELYISLEDPDNLPNYNDMPRNDPPRPHGNSTQNQT